MNMMLGLIILCVCTYVGYNLSKKFTLRTKYYNSFLNFNKKLQNEISFTQATLFDILEDKREDGDFYWCVATYLSNNKFEFVGKYIKDEELDFLNNYLKTIGKSDKDTQINYLKSAEKTIEEKLSLSSYEEKRYKTLYIKLGFLIGLIAFIILL